MFWLLLFLLFELITVCINYQFAFKNNLSLFAYTSVIYLVMYPNSEHKNKGTLRKELAFFLWVYIALCAIAITVSLCTFCFQINRSMTYMDTMYYIGLYKNRLWGIFANPNMPVALIGLTVCVIQSCLVSESSASKLYKRLSFAVIGYTSIVCFAHLSLAQSRTSLYSLMTFVAFFVVLVFVKKFNHIKKRVVIPAVIVLATISIIVTAVALNAVRTGLRYVPTMVSKGLYNEEIGPVDVERDPDDNPNGVMTGRPDVWKIGIETFQKKPLFGFGSATFSNNIYLGKEQLSHFHNLIVQALAANGVFGTVALGGFAISLIICVFRYLFNKGVKDWAVYALVAYMAMLCVLSMAEVELFFTLGVSNILFAVLAGYLTSLIGDDQPYLAPDRFLRGVEARMTRHLPGKGKRGAEKA